MKKIIYILCFVLLSISAVYSQTLLLNENFDLGTTGNSDIRLLDSLWKRPTGVKGPSYVYPGLSFTGYPGSGVGGSIGFANSLFGANDGDVNKTFQAVSSQSTIYTSFLVNLTSARAAADCFFHLGQNPFVTSSYPGKFFAVANGTSGWNIGIAKLDFTPIMNTTQTLELKKTYLVVMKYIFNTAANRDDAVSVYVYSSMPASESSPCEASITAATDTTLDPVNIGAVTIRQSGNSPTGTIDGIRVSTDWATAVLGKSSGIKKSENGIPSEFSLSQNYPNPFNPSTEIDFSIPQSGNYNLKVYDIFGKEIETLVNNKPLSTGKYKVTFSPLNLSSGTYIYRLTGNNVNLLKKMLFVK
jgi:hypothetical protein